MPSDVGRLRWWSSVPVHPLPLYTLCCPGVSDFACAGEHRAPDCIPRLRLRLRIGVCVGWLPGLQWGTGSARHSPILGVRGPGCSTKLLSTASCGRLRPAVRSKSFLESVQCQDLSWFGARVFAWACVAAFGLCQSRSTPTPVWASLSCFREFLRVVPP
jgi:hypothetical protein